MNAFDKDTPNDPVTAENRKMVGCSFKNSNMANCSFEGCVLKGTVFRDTSLEGCTFDNINLGHCSFNNIGIGQSKITHSCFTRLEIDGNLTDMVVNGVPLTDMIEAWEKTHGKKFP